MDKRRLYREFAASFDRSAIESAFLRIESGPPQGDLLGEGSDCSAYLLPRASLVLTIPKPSFLRSHDVGIWRRRLAVLQEIEEVPLIPPLRTIKIGEHMALVTPYGDQEDSAIHEHWQPLPALKEACVRELRERGLFINDVLQVKSRHGVPFVVDFSDLRLANE